MASLERTATPGIFKRGGRYVVVYRDPGGRQRKRFARTLAEARDVKAALRADVARGEYRALSRIDFTAYAREWIITYNGRTSRGLGDGTRADYEDALERDAIPFFGRARLAAIEPRDLKRYTIHLADRGLAPASVAKAVAPVRALLATAVEEGLIRSNPAAGLRIARHADDHEQDEQVKALTDDELAALLVEIPEAWQLFFRFVFESCLRIGEAIEARFGDLDLGEGWLSVDRQFSRGKVCPPKGRKRRRVRLSETTARELWNLRKASRAGDDDLIFTAERGGRIIPSNLMSRVLKPAAVRAGIGDWPGFHTLRHTGATALFRGGWNAVQVQKFLGHSDPGFTLRTYVHLLPEDLPATDFLAQVGNTRATRPAETGRDAATDVTAGIPAYAGETSDEPRHAERLAAHS